MHRKWQAALLGLSVILGIALLRLVAADPPSQQQRRDALMKNFKDGNWKDAYDGLRKLALDAKCDPLQVSNDLNTSVQCLQRLGRVDEVDELREAVIKVHAKNWKLLETAAQSYSSVDHYGFIVAGQFNRGNKRGGGRYVSTNERDRVRALQLMQDALAAIQTEKDKPAVAQFHLRLANFLLNGAGYHAPWRLQYLTDLTKLPDYEDGNYYRYAYYGQRGAPVDADGNPVYYSVPKSWQDATNDGERWRFCLTQAAEFDAGLVNETDMIFANFLRSQFEVQTMAQGRYGFRGGDDKGDKKEGTFTLHTLAETETIAKLASGIKRFAVPDEFNWFKIYERVAARAKSNWGEQARNTIAQDYEDRRQYVKAAAAWKKAIEEYGAGQNAWRQNRLDQIVGNWGLFETVSDQPAGGKGATVDFRFRNGNKVSFEAHAIKVDKLLADVKAYLESKPGQPDWQRTNIGDLGYRLVQQQQQQYLGDKVANWDLELKPRPQHVDERVTVQTPLSNPGAYLLTGQMANGNMSRIILWVNDTAIVKKQLEGKNYYFVADAVTSKPVSSAGVEFFGWKTIVAQQNPLRYQIETTKFTQETDKDGQLILGNDKVDNHYQWLITATKAKDGVQGADRLAYYGFNNVWYGQRYDPEYNAVKVFGITDRPVYRPEHKMQFKFWIGHAKYDMQDNQEYANRPFTVVINNPKGEKVYEKQLTSDEFGGINDEMQLSKSMTLGTYYINVKDLGGTHFRIEEYKKPEYEVTVEAPKEPVQLGEKIEATITAKYYFGAPVTNAKVKYKVLRTSYSAGWYPRGSWDWFYGRGYWWFASDYPWYPGFGEWGCKRPTPWWWWGGNREQPEVVLENEVSVGPDGVVKVLIDTLPAKELHGDEDHKYAITAEVTDESRRTIVGTGDVLVSRKPFQVFTWVDRGHYRVGDTIKAAMKAQTLAQKPVEGKGELTLYQISYDAKSQPVEKAVQTWKVDTDVEGQARQQLDASKPGQYRLAYKLTDSKGHAIEGGYVFVVRGEGFDGKAFRFNDLELITDKREYAPGDKVKLLINTNRDNGTVVLFVRATNGVYLEPKVIRLQGKSVQEEVSVVQRDMPNFFIEALTVVGSKVQTETREVIVPPEKRVLNVEVVPNQQEYLPGQKATVKVKLTDFFGKPFEGSTVVTVYDKSVEYIAGGGNVPEIKDFFWKWRRQHQPRTETSLAHHQHNVLRQGEIGMSFLGVFGYSVVEELAKSKKDGTGGDEKSKQAADGKPGGFGGPANQARAMKGLAADRDAVLAEGEQLRARSGSDKASERAPANAGGAGEAPVAVRKNFADTAFWKAAVKTNKDGLAELSFDMPEQLTGWKIKTWAMGQGSRVGQGEVEVVTKKNILVRLQAPRFFVEKDEVVLSANVHNYLKADKLVKVSLELDGGTLECLGSKESEISIKSGGDKRVDWRVKVKAEGEAVVRMKAVTDVESDAMEMRFPCYVHGMLKMDSFAGVIRPEQSSGKVTFSIPAERRINETRLEVRYSPTLAGAMVDALPYMVDYPYGCTEQTLNRFLPTVITQKILKDMKLDLKEIQKKRTNLNAQEIGDAQERAKGWKRFERNPVFDEAEVQAMTADGLKRLTAMQCSDGGWGWFSGWGEHSYPHTTAVVVHGLQIAKASGVQLTPNMLERGVAWLQSYQAQQIFYLNNAPTKTWPWKDKADNLDALVYMVLGDAGSSNAEMREFLYRDRTDLAVYAKAMYGLALHKEQQAEKLAMMLKNIEQFVVEDDENQTAYLKLPGNQWWYWYGSENEAHAYYLKLLSRTNPKGQVASRLVKYLLNNRKHSTYWNSTRDTAVCIEAMAEYMTASGEDRPDMTIEVWLDGKKHKDVQVNASNLFTFDNVFVLTGDAVDTGKHVVELKKKGTGPVYFNAYVTNFTLEDFITKAGLEVKVNRKYYKLTKVDKKVKVEGSRGQALDQKVEKYERSELANLAELKSGDLVEVELEIDSKNDYEYLCFEDMKAAGFEPMEVRSGYTANDMRAYVEFRDDKVCFFVRTLARGKHSVSYRLRAEIPGKFSALPARGYAMYAPELKGNSDEIKLQIKD